ncbi:MAG: hypothetical protein A4E49_01891 [Methanosaeta sp. PtaU1.Bin112]|nr:MAG: hypothetical protein A4E49_01891 [Methanosaeta sp. PtaU1.Bin112]
MNRSRVLMCVAALAACFLIGIACGEDYLGGGYVGSFDRSSFMDEGISGMVKWMDLPVPGTTFIPYREYYKMVVTPVMPAVSDTVSGPIPYNIAGQMPFGVYYRNGLWLPYATYATSQTARSNDLWISGQTNWTQYAAIPLGSSLQLVASVPSGGAGTFFKLIQTNAVSTDYKTAQFEPGYSSMSFIAGQTGRHMFYFVVNNQPSNLIIVDVFSQAPG